MEGENKRIAILCNPMPENERLRRMVDSIGQFLNARNISFSLFHRWPQTLDGFTDAWIVGGDGTLNFFINQYRNTALHLSVFPGGTGNDFQWMLYRDLPVEMQTATVLSGTPRKVDAGICNGRLFLNGVGIGFDGAIVKDLVGKKKLAGKASYLLSILKHIVGYQEKAAVVKASGETIEAQSLIISVANGSRYGGGFMVAPNASVEDGLLDLVVVDRISPLKRIKYLPVIEKGEHLGLPFTTSRQLRRVQIQMAEKVHAHIDGEYVYDSFFDIEVLPAYVSFVY